MKLSVKIPRIWDKFLLEEDFGGLLHVHHAQKKTFQALNDLLIKIHSVQTIFIYKKSSS